jgi:hypothetical protein
VGLPHAAHRHFALLNTLIGSMIPILDLLICSRLLAPLSLFVVVLQANEQCLDEVMAMNKVPH